MATHATLSQQKSDSATNSDGAEGEGRQLNMFFAPSGKRCMCRSPHTRALSLSHVLMYATLQQSNSMLSVLIEETEGGV